MHDTGTNPNAYTLFDHTYYSELCALATSGSLNDTEWRQLKQHLSKCPSCKRVLQEYREIARTGMALLMPDHPTDESLSESWSVESAKRELFSRIARGEAGVHVSPHADNSSETRKPWWRAVLQWRWYPSPGYATVAVVLVTTIVCSYEIGARHGRSSTVAIQGEPRVTAQLQEMTRASNSAEASTETSSGALHRTQEQLLHQVQEAEKWKAQSTRLSAELQSQRAGFDSLQGQLQSLSADRDALSHKLQDSEAALHSLDQKFNEFRAQQDGDAKSSTNLQARIGDLSARLKGAEANVRQQEEFLAADRDVRELMGARNLYIADVYDVNRKGETAKPYGRVFYTAGKSLIFYAFDLDQQPHVRDASNFQLWGRRGSADRRPVNMGIFYLDSAANKRWVLKFDNPDALSKIDAVFVTVEPRGGSEKPSGKQLLFASLRTVASNHP